YLDYAAWQREWLSGEELNRQLDYWKKHLSGAPALVKLPTDRPRPPVQTANGARVLCILPPELLEGLRCVGQRQGATLFMTLMAGLQVLLARYSGQQDLVVGTVIANRTPPETEALIGFFLNSLAMRGDLSGNPSFRE